MLCLRSCQGQAFKTIILLGISLTLQAGLPITWEGRFGLKTDYIKNYRGTKSLQSDTDNGSQFITPASGSFNNASFQSYLFELSPRIIVNDGIALFANFSTGYGKGGLLGDSPSYKKEDTNKSFGNALYHHNFDSQSTVVLGQLYAELYTDTGTIIVGRHNFHWGLGLMYDAGKDDWDRFSSTRDGIHLNFKLGNFSIAPYYAKINTSPDLTKASNTKEYGVGIKYHNLEKDLEFGVLLARKKSDSYNIFYKSGANSASSFNLGRTKLKIRNFYARKSLGKLNLSLEVPILRGDLGNVYQQASNAKVRALGLYSKNSYRLTSQIKARLEFGYFSGENGQSNEYQAFFAHPNFQIAHILFRYNYHAFNNPNESIFDSYVVNTKFLKIATEYQQDKWLWSASYIMAVADETAQNGNLAYNHQKNKIFTATNTQDDNLGHEIDLTFLYKWNSSMSLSGKFAQLFTGDYWKFSNSGLNHETENIFAAELGLLIKF